MVMTSVDYDYLDTFGLTMAQGRFFSREYSTDASDAYVVNEAAVRAMEMEDPIGKVLKVWNLEKRIIGVVQDYHFESLHNEIIPMAMRIDSNWHNQACVRISPHRTQETLGFLETKWKEIYPEYPFEYHFLDESIVHQYRSEQAIGKIVTVFTILAMFISCLGILGLSSYTAEQRTKEIGIRKVLGASVLSIVKYISKEFVWLVSISNLIIWPLAYFSMNRWLQTFAYRISLDLWMFAVTGITVLALSLGTVSWQIIRAATANPVDSLRYE
jgi:putative ABC transport system permease protein